MDLLEIIALKIKDLATKKKYSAQKLGDEIGLTKQAVYDIYNGKTSISIKNLEKIAKVFKVPLSYFLSENIEIEYEEPQKNINTQQFYENVESQTNNFHIEKEKYLERLLEEKEKQLKEKERLIEMLLNKSN